MRNQLFTEKFENNYRFAKNGGVLVGTAVISKNTLILDGSGYARFDKVTTPFGDMPRTIRARIKRTSAGGGVVAAFNTASGKKFIALALSLGGLSYAYTDGVTTSVTINEADMPPLNEFVHYVLVCTGTKILYYLEGSLKKDSGTILIDAKPATSLTVGDRLDVANQSFEGEVQDVLIEDRAWTAEEVLADYQNSLYNYDDNLVGAWYMQDLIDDSTPYTTSDVSKFKNDLTLGDGSTSTTFPSKLSSRNGFHLDGGDYFKTAFSKLEGTTQPFSVGVWFKPEDMLSASNSCLFHLTDSSGNRILTFGTFQTGSDNILATRNTNSAANSIESATTLRDGIIYHAILTFNGTTAAPTLYLDGADDSQVSATLFGEDDDNDVLYIGSRKGNLPFIGDIYSVKVWNVCLTPKQAAAEFSRGHKYLGNL